MSEEFGDSTYTSALQTFMNGVRSATKTPGGMVYIDQWGSLRHAINVAFIGFKVVNYQLLINNTNKFVLETFSFVLPYTKCVIFILS